MSFADASTALHHNAISALSQGIMQLPDLRELNIPQAISTRRQGLKPAGVRQPAKGQFG
jgi:hypothetical protein